MFTFGSPSDHSRFVMVTYEAQARALSTLTDLTGKPILAEPHPTYSKTVLHSAPPPSRQDVSASPQVSFPYTQNLRPISTHLIHQPNPFSILNPDTPISTTSLIPTPPPHFSYHTRQLKCSTLRSPTPSFLSVPQISISSSPYKRTLVSQSSIPNSPPDTFEDIQNFLKMAQGNTPLPYPAPYPSVPTPATFKVFADIHPPPSQVPSTPLPPTPSQHTPPSLPLPLEYSHESSLSQHCISPDILPDASSPSPISLSQPLDSSPPTSPTATSVFLDQYPYSFPSHRYTAIHSVAQPLIFPQHYPKYLILSTTQTKTPSKT
ncbi:uncharacterized protein [Penaeus vannamei]|uniref:uncharacterized protein n=1 Tax=Penaeus vannamei TaxID=6689 RepID=UPI00387F973B